MRASQSKLTEHETDAMPTDMPVKIRPINSDVTVWAYMIANQPSDDGTDIRMIALCRP